MEASEKPTHSEHTTVRAIGDRLVIEHLAVEDARAARVVQDRAEAGTAPAETVTKAIEIGARVIESESTAANVDFVRHELKSELGELGKELAGTLEDGGAELSERIAATFGSDRSDSVQQQIREFVLEDNQRQHAELMKRLTAEDGSNPLVAAHTRMSTAIKESEERHRLESARMRTEMTSLREHVAQLLERQEGDARVAEAEEAGTRKGRTFEERVHLAIEQIADGRGDVAHRVGDEKGAAGSKKGDTVVEIGGCDGPPLGRIAFEDKDDQLSKNKAWEELNGAMAERDAEFAVLVVAGEDKVPAGREQLVEYEGNKMIVAVDPDQPDGLALDLAYRYARLRVLLRREGELTLDAAGVRDAAEEARSALKQAQSIRLALTGVDKSSQKAREGLDAMCSLLEQRFDRIESLVSSADPA